MAEVGAARVTMDGLAARAGLGKGTVFRRFGSRAGIFQALLDDAERTFQEQVLSGPPPLGPGAAPLDRLIAYGQARIGFLIEHREIARATLDGSQPFHDARRHLLSESKKGTYQRIVQNLASWIDAVPISVHVRVNIDERNKDAVVGLIDDLVAHNAVGVVHGPAGAGKTFAVDAGLEALRAAGTRAVVTCSSA